MKYNKKAFTLIELLIVVLIIGILTAVAIPQYQKTVTRSEAISMLQLFKPFTEAYNLDYMERGTNPPNFEIFGVSLPADWTGADTTQATNGKWELSYYGGHDWRWITIIKTTEPYSNCGFRYLKQRGTGGHTYHPLDEIVCVENYTVGNNGSFCTKLFGGKYLGGDGGYRVYSLPL